VKFSEPGRRVIVSLRRDRDFCELVVSDAGAGIAPSFLPHVFDLFRQADASTTRTHGGLGLGLSIVRRITELHGGSVSAASQGLGLGAAFTVRLPAPMGVPASEPKPPAAPAVQPVDDDADLR
jgi:signal transduction histidine kinase